jgi:predicted nucleic acid-binding Zn ribbon protein
VWKLAGVEAPDEVEFEPLSALYVAGVTVPGGEKACGEGLREKLRDCRREGFVLLFVLLLPLVITLAMLISFRPCGLSARAASGLTVRMVLL